MPPLVPGSMGDDAIRYGLPLGAMIAGPMAFPEVATATGTANNASTALTTTAETATATGNAENATVDTSNLTFDA